MAIIKLFNFRIAKILMQTVSLRQQLQSIALIFN